MFVRYVQQPDDSLIAEHNFDWPSIDELCNEPGPTIDDQEKNVHVETKVIPPFVMVPPSSSKSTWVHVFLHRTFVSECYHNMIYPPTAAFAPEGCKSCFLFTAYSLQPY